MTRYQRNRRAGVIALVVAIALPFLLAQTGPSGGLPSKPTFAKVTARDANPTITLYQTDAAANEKLWRFESNGNRDLRLRACEDSGSNCVTALDWGGTGTTIDSLAVTAAALTVNAQEMTPSSGEFTASFVTACTTTPTIDFDWIKIGNLVTVYAEGGSGFTCTGDSTSFQTATGAVPVAIRPAVSGNSAVIGGFQDSGTAVLGRIVFSSTGQVSFTDCSAASTCGTIASWTASGNRDAAITGATLTYFTADL